LKFAFMAIPAMALLQQHDARRDILIEPASRRRAAIEARWHSELGSSELGAQSGRKNQPACFYLTLTLLLCLSHLSGLGRATGLACLHVWTITFELSDL